MYSKQTKYKPDEEELILCRSVFVIETPEDWIVKMYGVVGHDNPLTILYIKKLEFHGRFEIKIHHRHNRTDFYPCLNNKFILTRLIQRVLHIYESPPVENFDFMVTLAMEELSNKALTLWDLGRLFYAHNYSDPSVLGHYLYWWLYDNVDGVKIKKLFELEKIDLT
jgi:hypothetical protein